MAVRVFGADITDAVVAFLAGVAAAIAAGSPRLGTDYDETEAKTADPAVHRRTTEGARDGRPRNLHVVPGHQQEPRRAGRAEQGCSAKPSRDRPRRRTTSTRAEAAEACDRQQLAVQSWTSCTPGWASRLMTCRTRPRGRCPVPHLRNVVRRCPALADAAGAVARGRDHRDRRAGHRCPEKMPIMWPGCTPWASRHPTGRPRREPGRTSTRPAANRCSSCSRRSPTSPAIDMAGDTSNLVAMGEPIRNIGQVAQSLVGRLGESRGCCN